MTLVPPRSGYTLPVFACAAAVAALQHLYDLVCSDEVTLDLVHPAQAVQIPIEQVAMLKPGLALAMTRSDPGDNLDLTRDTPLWALVEWGKSDQVQPIVIVGGEGIGIDREQNQSAIYEYAQELLLTNLQRWLCPGDLIQVTLILPEGRALAQRTSNAAFGIVEGLSLLGTSGLSQPLSAPAQLEQFRDELKGKAAQGSTLVFCIGENGLDLARSQGIPESYLLKTANWLGPLLVEAGLQGITSLLLWGYHGKLIKLAGGIFHTHHHLADGRQEILSAHAACLGIPPQEIQILLNSKTTEAGLQHLRQVDAQQHRQWAPQVYASLCAAIDRRAQDYIRVHSNRGVQVGSVLFDRQRQVFAVSEAGEKILQEILAASPGLA
ncbi:cobalt-precorrin-5B (C(1))-methyltransferase [Synechococcales cyanobacterium C]|uniref:Cobalt-precorrin-5B C(1)-methyltransferase n=1 Tax=Petrachloros mirabilis ULC683 TaxID=2781853 RepID=A0A8K2A1T6_9CYAN|nr:cobalt-precorrin-5B (C(1))-methyltransferase CbiD [Petrachloros mirabilis]NCJ08138.1 cobalt-precorrin-5B (C(1))-methyltransferase [Petrachloros mirabilis ULC683]